MHWFWRAAIAVGVGCLYAALAVTRFQYLHIKLVERIVMLLRGRMAPDSWQRGLGAALSFFLPVLLLAFIIYGLLTLRYGPKAKADLESRCRKCGYILRGISEPRCPECGERI